MSMEILSPKDKKKLEKRAQKTQKKINRLLKKKLKGWEYDGLDEAGNVVFKTTVYTLKERG